MHESDHGLAWLYMGLATRWALEMKLHDARTFFESTSFTPSKHSIQEETSRVIWCREWGLLLQGKKGRRLVPPTD